jgi:hypothetical protein
MLKINRIQCSDGFIFYEAVFKGGNLYAYSINDMIEQLKGQFPILKFNLN